jgi:integral membrane sensor domain MASE1
LVGWAAAEFVHHAKSRVRPVLAYAAMTALIAGWSAVWFAFQIHRMPPYVPGATMDPTYAPPEAVTGLLVVAGAVVWPAGLIACGLSYRARRRFLSRVHPSPTTERRRNQ